MWCYACGASLRRAGTVSLKGTPDSGQRATRQPSRRRSAARWRDPIWHAGQPGGASRCSAGCPPGPPRPGSTRRRRRTRPERPAGARSLAARAFGRSRQRALGADVGQRDRAASGQGTDVPGGTNTAAMRRRMAHITRETAHAVTRTAHDRPLVHAQVGRLGRLGRLGRSWSGRTGSLPRPSRAARPGVIPRRCGRSPQRLTRPHGGPRRCNPELRSERWDREVQILSPRPFRPHPIRTLQAGPLRPLRTSVLL